MMARLTSEHATMKLQVESYEKTLAELEVIAAYVVRT